MRPRVYHKNYFILNKCRDKNVLDLGCVGHTSFRFSDLYMGLKGVARTLVGVDNRPIPPMREFGFPVFPGDVENLSKVVDIKGKTFDVIVAGDLIEHLFNQGKFINSIKPFCHKDTEVIVTTPNCLSTHFFIPNFTKRVKVRTDHTCWHSEQTLKQLFSMKGFRCTEFHFRDDQKINGIRPIFKVAFKRLFPRCADGLIGVFKKC